MSEDEDGPTSQPGGLDSARWLPGSGVQAEPWRGRAKRDRPPVAYSDVKRRTGSGTKKQKKASDHAAPYMASKRNGRAKSNRDELAKQITASARMMRMIVGDRYDYWDGQYKQRQSKVYDDGG